MVHKALTQRAILLGTGIARTQGYVTGLGTVMAWLSQRSVLSHVCFWLELNMQKFAARYLGYNPTPTKGRIAYPVIC